jgi:adenylosuccinate synthase
MVIGAQFGDEGKGKIVDSLCKTGKYSICVRVNGSDNAGHSVVLENGEKIAFNQIPIGAIHGMECVISRGCVIDLKALEEEIGRINDFSQKKDGWELFIDSRCHVKTTEHRERDRIEESSRAAPIGTTLSGNGPAYSDKYARKNQRICDVDLTIYPRIRSDVTISDTSMLLSSRYLSGRILVEGAHGMMLDIDHGTYPFCTSSGCTPAAACHSMGVSPSKIGRVIGVVKPYITRVGTGAFPTEIFGPKAEYIRGKGHEYGTVTKRPRRIAWLDISALAYVIRVAGITELALCKADMIEFLDPLKICIGYKGQSFSSVPPRDEDYSEVEPLYNTYKGDTLPEMMSLMKRMLGIPITIISKSPRREAISD